MRQKLLIADDEPGIVDMLKSYFSPDYEVFTAYSGREVLAQAAQAPDLILLDINMPDMDGLEVCRQIRNKVSCPILFLTARVEEQDRVNGLLSGGDDYILKPFSLKELEARITAHLNREERRQRNTKYYSHNGMMIDYTAREVEVEGGTIELTKTEYAIIEFLSMHPGQVFDREQIYERICGCDAEGDSRSVTELVRRIRKKLAEHTQRDYIETVWGVGYKWIN